MSIYDNLPSPAGDHPDFVKFNSPGDSVTLTIADLWSFMSKPFDATKQAGECFAASGTTPEGAKVSVSFGGPTSRFSLYRQFFTMRPAVGSTIRVTFTGYEGQAKIFTLEVAPGGPVAAAPAPQAPAPGFAPQPPAQPEPQSWAPPAGTPAQPWAQPAPAPAPAAPAPAPAPPWGS